MLVKVKIQYQLQLDSHSHLCELCAIYFVNFVVKIYLKNEVFCRIRDVEGAEGGANRNERRDDLCVMF